MRLLLRPFLMLSSLGSGIGDGRAGRADPLLEPSNERAADNDFLAFLFFASSSTATTDASSSSRCEDQVFDELLVVWIRLESVDDLFLVWLG